MSAASPVGEKRTDGAFGCSSGHRSSVASSWRGVSSRVQKKEERVGAWNDAGFEVTFGIKARALKALRQVARVVLFALVDAGQRIMDRTPHFPNQPLEPTTTAVTIRAGARLAPAAVVAHL